MNDIPQYPDAPDPQTYEHGMEYQDWVRPRLACVGFNVQVNTSKKFQLQQGESAQGVEIKLDNRCCTPPYNQVSIEIEEKSRRSMERWTPSGIFAADNHLWYVVGSYKIVFIFARKHLKSIFRHENPRVVEYNGTMRRFFIPARRALAVAGVVLATRDSPFGQQLALQFEGSTKSLFGWDGGEHQIVRARPNGDNLVLEVSQKLTDAT
jgi:hypothetical protein